MYVEIKHDPTDGGWLVPHWQATLRTANGYPLAVRLTYSQRSAQRAGSRMLAHAKRTPKVEPYRLREEAK